MTIVFNEPWEAGTRRFSDQHFDLAVCDIPYGINVGKMAYLNETKSLVKNRGKHRNASRNKKAYTLKDWDKSPPDQNYFDELRRISKNQIIFGIEYVTWSGVGPGRIKWDKGFSEEVSFNRYETAYCSLIENERIIPLLWAGMQQAKSLTEPMVSLGNKKLNEKRIHPCHKPRLLYKRLLADYAFPGAKIIDTHVGGGSIRIECDLAGLEFTGFEIDPEYYKEQELNFARYKKQLRLF